MDVSVESIPGSNYIGYSRCWEPNLASVGEHFSIRSSGFYVCSANDELNDVKKLEKIFSTVNRCNCTEIWVTRDLNEFFEKYDNKMGWFEIQLKFHSKHNPQVIIGKIVIKNGYNFMSGNHNEHELLQWMFCWTLLNQQKKDKRSNARKTEL